MQLVIDFAPWVIFGLVYQFAGGLMPATAALMAAIVLPLAYGWLRERKIRQMHLVLALLVWVFGAATLLLHDVRFLQWKASVYYWLLGLALIGSAFIGKQSLLERVMGKTLAEGGVTLPSTSWRNSSLLMGGLYIVFGLANIWVAMNRSEAEWVTFKVWILTPVAMVLTIALFFWLIRGILFEKDNGEKPDSR
jgi:intracellular septation protein